MPQPSIEETETVSEASARAEKAHTAHRSARREADESSAATFEAEKAKTTKAASKPAGRANATVAEQVVNAIKPLLEKNQPQELDVDADAAARFNAVKTEVNGEPAPDATAAKPEATEPEKDPNEIPAEILDPELKDAVLDAEPPANLSEGAKVNWRQLRERAAEIRSENATLRNQLAQEKQAAADREAASRENQIADEVYDSKADDDALAKAAAKAGDELVVFKTIPGNDLWNEGVARRKAEAAEFFRGQISIEQAAEYAHAAVAGRELQKMLTNVIGKLKAANSELARLKPAQPSLGDAAGTLTPSNNDASMSQDQRAMANFERARAEVAARGN